MEQGVRLKSEDKLNRNQMSHGKALTVFSMCACVCANVCVRVCVDAYYHFGVLKHPFAEFKHSEIEK